MGSVPGALVGGVVIALVEALGGYLISPLVGTGFVYLLFIAVMLVRPGGLMGVPEAAQLGE
jgi:branched-chain amino acid transport system permease protein